MPPRLLERLGMTSWIVGIDKENPEHWAFAQQAQFWDMTKNRRFDVGDTLYFWQAGQSLLGSVKVTRSTYEIPPRTQMPWNIDDAKRDQYRYRVEFTVEHASSIDTPTWSQLQAATGVRGATNFGPREVPTGGEAWLRRQVGEESREESAPVALARQWWESDADSDESALEADLRTRVEASIVMRQGQGRFRRLVLAAYGSTCCISGTTVESVLDAAHVSPYMGAQTDLLTNALLLRTDLHTLFDRHQLTITPSLTVRLAPELHSSDYAHYEDVAIRTPLSGPGPSAEYLSGHNHKCRWL